MPKLLEQINQDLKRAMMAKDVFKVSVLRMLIAAIRNKEISLRQGGRAELTDEQIIEAMASEIKKRQDSVIAYEQGHRQDLADKEAGEIEILRTYLPAQLSDHDLEKIIRDVIALGASDFGKVMGQTMAKVKGRAQGNKVGEMVRKLLEK